jgi:hypothetical protein
VRPRQQERALGMERGDGPRIAECLVEGAVGPLDKPPIRAERPLVGRFSRQGGRDPQQPGACLMILPALAARIGDLDRR